jgi:hypothetical protein
MFDFDLETAPLPLLEEEVCAWAGRIAAATCGWLLLLAAFDRREGWRGIGIRSCAAWLSWRCGMGPRASREHLHTAHALERLPAMRELFAAGRLSYSKARAIARVAESETVEIWLHHAVHCTASQLERLASAHRRLHRGADPEQRDAPRRVSWTQDDGTLRLTAVLPPDEGARLVAALNAARASLDDTTHPTRTTPRAQDSRSTQAVRTSQHALTGDPSRTDPTSEPDHATTAPAPTASAATPVDGQIVAAPRDRGRDADALLALADGFLHHTAPTLTDPTRHTINIHIDLATLTRPRPDSRADTNPSAPHTAHAPPPPAPIRCDIEPGIGLSPAIARRLGCDALLRAVLTNDAGTPLHHGRRTRTATRRLREAVHTRDHATCQFPSCDRTRWLQLHHLTHWADHGETTADNLTPICGEHHRTIHDENITLRRATDGSIEAVLPDGRVLRPAPPLAPGSDPRPLDRLRAAVPHVAPTAIIPNWGGEPLRLHDSLYALANANPNAA